MYDTIKSQQRSCAHQKVDNRRGRMGAVQNQESCLLRKTGRYPHLSNATEKDLSGPPRVLAGRGLESRSVLSLCHYHTCCGRRNTSVTLLATSVIASTFDFFSVPGPILINSFVEIRYCMTCVVVFLQHAHAHAHPPLIHPKEGWSDVYVCQRCFLKVPKDGSQLARRPAMCRCRHI
jgi:hypothetical protein